APPLLQLGKNEVGRVEAHPEGVFQLDKQAVAADNTAGVEQSAGRLMVECRAILQQSVGVTDLKPTAGDADIHDLREHVPDHPIHLWIAVSIGNEGDVNIGKGGKLAPAIAASSDDDDG